MILSHWVFLVRFLTRQIIDELIISEFYILFNLVLFRFSFILFYYYFLFEQFTLTIKYISGTNIGWSSLEAKERG